MGSNTPVLCTALDLIQIISVLVIVLQFQCNNPKSMNVEYRYAIRTNITTDHLQLFCSLLMLLLLTALHHQTVLK